MKSTINIKVDYLDRVEGQGALDIKLDPVTKQVRFKIFEPPRFFESFLLGRKYDEVHELASRICGICPIAHQITALRAVENAIGLKVSSQTKNLRKILALSAVISSHVLSLYFLTTPDYWGQASIISLGREQPDLLARALKLKQLGNDLGDIIGGRAIHPVYTVINGFTALPTPKQLDDITKRLVEARQDALETVRFFGRLKYPELDSPSEQVAIADEHRYAINRGRMTSTGDWSADEKDYRNFVEEQQISYSYAKGSKIKGRDTFLVGPLARVNINFGQLSNNARRVAQEIGFNPPRLDNPFDAIIARAIEVVHAIDECVELIDGLSLKEEVVAHRFRPGEGHALTEAPRGLLYHSYKINDAGLVESADIVPPTAHNAKNIEKDLTALVQAFRHLPINELTLKCEMLVRAYDPCISCSVH